MKKEEDDFNAESLDLPRSREFTEAGALLSCAAGERKPPARLKTRLMASLRPASPWIVARNWTIGAAAFAALLFALFSSMNGPAAVVLEARGDVRIDGMPAASGAKLRSGQSVSVSGDAEAFVSVGGRAGFRLSRDAEARLVTEGKAIEVRLKSGWLLSAVKTGTPYAVAVEHGKVSALGTDFIVKVRDGLAYTCICHGKLGLVGFPQDRIESAHHGAIAQKGFPSGAAVGMEGHSDEETAALRRRLGLEVDR
jgi:hypothetical protein